MTLLKVILLCVLSYAFGAAVSIIVAHPGKAFDAGWKAAKEMFSDYDRGFQNGIEAAQQVNSDFNAGFKAGWDEAFEAIRSIELEE